MGQLQPSLALSITEWKSSLFKRNPSLFQREHDKSKVTMKSSAPEQRHGPISISEGDI